MRLEHTGQIQAMTFLRNNFHQFEDKSEVFGLSVYS